MGGNLAVATLLTEGSEATNRSGFQPYAIILVKYPYLGQQTTKILGEKCAFRNHLAQWRSKRGIMAEPSVIDSAEDSDYATETSVNVVVGAA